MERRLLVQLQPATPTCGRSEYGDASGAHRGINCSVFEHGPPVFKLRQKIMQRPRHDEYHDAGSSKLRKFQTGWSGTRYCISSSALLQIVSRVLDGDGELSATLRSINGEPNGSGSMAEIIVVAVTPGRGSPVGRFSAYAIMVIY